MTSSSEGDRSADPEVPDRVAVLKDLRYLFSLEPEEWEFEMLELPGLPESIERYAHTPAEEDDSRQFLLDRRIPIQRDKNSKAGIYSLTIVTEEGIEIIPDSPEYNIGALFESVLERQRIEDEINYFDEGNPDSDEG